MAFKFFRRQKKIVFGVMIALMVAFMASPLIQGLGGRRGKVVLGHVGGKKITRRMAQSAALEVDILRRHLGLARSPEFGTFLVGCSRGDRLGIGWWLLRHEAGEMGIRVTEGQVDDFLAQLGLVDNEYERMLAKLRDAKTSEKQFRSAVAGFLQVIRAFQAARVSIPPSLAEQRLLYRDLTEQIELAMVTFQAGDFTEGLAEPDDEKINEMFARHKEVLADHPTNDTPFGFGYRLPDQADVAYLLIDREAVELAVEPPEEQMWEYWRQHKGKMTRTVETSAPATTGPGGEPSATAPAIKTRKVPITSYSEARPQILQIFKADAAEVKMAELVRLAKSSLQRFGQTDDAYPKAVAAMLAPAEELLARPAGKLPAGTITIGQLVEILQETSGVKIAYPFGKHGDHTLDADVKLQAQKDWEKLTLKGVLDKAAAAVKFPPIEWVTCQGFRQTVFPSKPVNLTPVSAGRTGLVALRELNRDDVLRWAQTGEEQRGLNLAAVVATAQEFRRSESQASPLITTGKDFRRAMYVTGARSGRMLWRLMAAVKTHSPKTITPEIRKKIIEDFKTQQAYEKALAAAKKMLAELDELEKAAGEEAKPDKPAENRSDKNNDDKQQAELSQLAKLAEKSDLIVVMSGPITRKQVGMDLLENRTTISYPYVLGVGVNPSFVEEALALVPSDPNRPTGRPGAVIELRRSKKVMLIQRVGYRPATEPGFLDAMVLVRYQIRGTPYQAGRLPLTHVFQSWQSQRDLISWFAWRAITDGQRAGIEIRTGFAPEYD